MNRTIAFIGGGNMARSLIGGLLARGWRTEQIVVADPMPAALESLRTQLGVRVTDDNATAVRDADIVVLAVKPQEMQRAADGIRDAISAQTSAADLGRCRHSRIATSSAGCRAFRSCARCPTARRCRAAG